MIPKTDLDYIELYAHRLKNDNSFFKQQKTLIESQLHGSSELFRKMFGTQNSFKINARKHLKGIGLILLIKLACFALPAAQKAL